MINKEEYIKKIELLFDFKIKTKKHLISFFKQDFITNSLMLFKDLTEDCDLKYVKDIKQSFKEKLKNNKEVITENSFIDILAFLYNYEKIDSLENRFIYELKDSETVKNYYMIKLDEEGFIKILSDGYKSREELRAEFSITPATILNNSYKIIK